MKILIAVPTYENIYPDTFKAIYDIDKGGHDVDFDFMRGYDAANARIKIARACVDKGYDFVLMVDSDVVIPKDALINLLEDEESEPKPGMAVGYCLSRPKTMANEKNKTTIFKFGNKFSEELKYTAKELNALRDNGQYKVQVRGCGFACVLIHRSVFERIEMPWFEWHIYSNGAHVSEDLFFCKKLEAKGIPIFVDTRIACGHMMRYVKWP